jgi:hypothetical protein
MNVNPQNRQKVLLIATASVIALYVLDAVLITPLTTTWKTHAAEIVKLQKDVARGRGLIERGPQTQRKWTEMQAGALPKDAAQAEQDLISAFDRWGRENRIELGSIKPQWKRGTDRYSTLECRVDATGTLATLSRFLYELEKSPIALRVDSVELTARDEGGNVCPRLEKGARKPFKAVGECAHLGEQKSIEHEP